ncbi:MAG: tRNA pseudouridine(38-40) synthase TruA [Vallitaleaceae bacterium]|jgi:tRNA pseudouridine38-40 synthase|nr:tRNA pseudouridine(38-40) synthase TruA [Vallitaleaceae bacterium]
MQNYKMVIAYDGRRYKGFRKTRSDAEKSIQGKLESILEKLYETEIEVISAISTNAGVHAQQLVINFNAPNESISDQGIFDYFETYLPDDIVTFSVEKADARFHSRYGVKTITYEYRLWKSDAPHRPIFDRQYVNVMKAPLRVNGMQKAAGLLEGEHDFAAYATKSKANSSVKTLTEITIEETEYEIIITMKADGFLLNMERFIVGTLIQVGLGERSADTVVKGFKTQDSHDVGHKAMAHALCLKEVTYE